MRKVKKAILTIVSISFVLALLSSPSTVLAKKGISVNKFQITFTGDQENAPLIYRDLVVYRRHYSPDVDIFAYDLKNGTESLLVQRPGHQSPAGLFNNYLVYNEEIASDNVDVRIKNIKTGKDFPIAEGPGYQTAGAIWGSYVAYIDGYNCGPLYIYNIYRRINFSTGQTACRPINVWSNILVWSDWHNTYVYGYNVGTKELFVIAEGSGQRTTPDVFGDTVVWVEYKDNKSEIWEKDLVSGAANVVYETTSSRLSWPTISNQYVAWVDDRGVEAHDIFVQKRRTREVVEVSNDGPQQPSPTIPDIYKDTVVWMSWHTGNGDIYGATFK